jgi:hypothetical protein
MSSLGSRKFSLFIALCPLFVGLACLTVASPSEAAGRAASAKSGNWNDPSTWVSGRVPANDDYVAIIRGNRVTIPTGTAVTNRGGIQVESGALVNDGTLNSSGRLTIPFSSVGQNNGTLVNTGTMTVENAVFTNAGTLSNEQVLVLVVSRFAARIVNTATGVLNNKGKLDAQGIVQNDGKFNNAGQFTLASAAGIPRFEGAGAVVNEQSGTFTIVGNLAGNGPFVNAGTLQISNTGLPSQEGFWVRRSMENRGSIRLGFVLRVEAPGILTNTKEGTITSAGSRLVNRGRVENYGSIVGGECAQCSVANVGTFNNYCGATAARVDNTAPTSVPCGPATTGASTSAPASPAPPAPPMPPTASFGTSVCGAVRGTTLTSGSEMKPGTSLQSPNGEFELAYQTDGNLVVYEVPSRRALWSSKTNGVAAFKLVMETDGTVVARKPDSSAAWSTNTRGNDGAVLSLQDDGNLVVYRKNGCRAVWSRR